jgi:hypothetical protein
MRQLNISAALEAVLMKSSVVVSAQNTPSRRLPFFYQPHLLSFATHYQLATSGRVNMDNGMRNITCLSVWAKS